MGKRLVALSLCLLAAGAASSVSAEDETPEGYPSIAEIVKGGGCAPRDDMARILKSAKPLDFAPNWSNANYVGTSWTFMPKRYVKTELDGGLFLQGDLISPRGGVTDKNVFILYSEWSCGE